MELQRKYYKVTSVIIISLFMVSISYYQQVALQHISTLARKYLPKHAIIMASPSPAEQVPSVKVVSVYCTGYNAGAKDSSTVKKI